MCVYIYIYIYVYMYIQFICIYIYLYIYMYKMLVEHLVCNLHPWLIFPVQQEGNYVWHCMVFPCVCVPENMPDRGVC